MKTFVTKVSEWEVVKVFEYGEVFYAVYNSKTGEFWNGYQERKRYITKEYSFAVNTAAQLNVLGELVEVN